MNVDVLKAEILGPALSAIISAWTNAMPKHYHTLIGGLVPIVRQSWSPIMLFAVGGNAAVSRTIGSARPIILGNLIAGFNALRGDNMGRETMFWIRTVLLACLITVALW